MRPASPFALLLAPLLLAARCNDCGPQSPTGPCEVDCGSYTCGVSYACCPDGMLCCPEGDTCMPDDSGGHCDAPWPDEQGRRRSSLRAGTWKRR